MAIDWYPSFTQAEVLRAVPGLKAKTLQNWNARGLLDWDYSAEEFGGPGKGGRRLYTVEDMITLCFMGALVGLGHPPNSAAELAWAARQQASFLFDESPQLRRWLPGETIELECFAIDVLSLAIVIPISEDKWRVSFTVPPEYSFVRSIGRRSCLLVEFELLIIDLVNRLAEIGGAKMGRRI